MTEGCRGHCCRKVELSAIVRDVTLIDACKTEGNLSCRQMSAEGGLVAVELIPCDVVCLFDFPVEEELAEAIEAFAPEGLVLVGVRLSAPKCTLVKCETLHGRTSIDHASETSVADRQGLHPF